MVNDKDSGGVAENLQNEKLKKRDFEKARSILKNFSGTGDTNAALEDVMRICGRLTNSQGEILANLAKEKLVKGNIG